ncbi:MAG: hypothetical protein ACRD3E_06745 [Terriglobales bacterium]
MSEQAQASFKGWAIVELMGHQREIGYVTTEYFGPAALFRIDSPEIPEREFELTRPEYVETEDGDRVAPRGAKVKRSAIPARTRMVAPGALYALNPCTEEAARKAIENAVTRRLILLDVPKEVQGQLPPAPIEAEYDEPEEGEEMGFEDEEEEDGAPVP